MTHAAEVDLPFLSLRDVGVRFGENVALSGVAFDLPAGGIGAVAGANGAGKTTLLRLLAGTLEPSTGRIAWPRSGSRPGVALVAQSVALYPFLTLRENCLASGRMQGLRGATLRARAEDVIARTLCTGREHQLVGSLSGGYQRRAAIAAALMADAALVVLDEPTTGLDVEGREAIVAILRGIAAAGKTVVVATHDFSLADATAEFVLFLRAGRLEAAGPLKLLRRHLFAAKKHVDVTLAQPPDAVQTGVLAALDATRHSPERYGLLSEVDAGGCPAVLRPLHEAGLALRETRIRDAGTALLFERFCLDRRMP